MATPKLLVPAAAVAGLSLTCLGLRMEPKPTHDSKEVIHEVSRSGVQRIVRRIWDPATDQSVQEAKDLWQEKYEKRCVTKNGESEFDFNLGCDAIVLNLSERMNDRLKTAQLEGHLEELESFNFCPTFHWVDDKNRTGRDMLASPGAHSHYEYEDMECVSSIYAFTEEESPYSMVCNLATLCQDEDGNRVQLGNSYKDPSCDMRTRNNISKMFKVLADGLEPMED